MIIQGKEASGIASHLGFKPVSGILKSGILYPMIRRTNHLKPGTLNSRPAE